MLDPWEVCFYVVPTQWKLGTLAGDTSASYCRQPGGHKSPIAYVYITGRWSKPLCNICVVEKRRKGDKSVRIR